MNSARNNALGKWRGILSALGVDPSHLGKNKPCPLCAGKDRFSFTDVEGAGTWYCRKCESGDGFQLLMLLNGWDFATAARQVEQVVGGVARQQPEQVDTDKRRRSLNRLWSGARPVKPGDPVARYLASRGVGFSPALRYHQAAFESETKQSLPAMLALIHSPTGEPVSIHRTYLQVTRDGVTKAAVASPKKIMPPVGTIKGGAVRLFPAGERLAICEGIETALAVWGDVQLPVWAAISAPNLETFVPPDGVREVVIYADNDESWTGQAAAFALARRYPELVSDVLVPPERGDFLDCAVAS